MATIKDVALKAGASVGTVSRYLNGYKIKEENKFNIDAAIKELDFTINQIARGLKTNKTNTIGVLIPGLSNVFSLQVISGMEKRFHDYGYNILVCNSSGDLQREKEKLRLLKDSCVDGIILMPVSDTSEHLIDFGILIVQIDRLAKGINLDGVIADNVHGVYNAMESIIKGGHKRIGFIAGNNSIYTSRERVEGYLMALKDYAVDIDEALIIYSDFEKIGGEQAINKLMALEEPPTVIFASNYYTWRLV